MVKKKLVMKSLEGAREQPSWEPTVVTMALAAEQEKARANGLDFKYFVIERLDENDELETFLHDFTQSLQSIPNGTHLHLAVRAGTHWTAFDLKISSNQVEIFCLDAAYQPVAELHMNSIQTAIHNAGSSSRAFMFEFDKAKSSDTGTDRKRLIQYSKQGCGIFTVDHLMRLNQFDVFERLNHMVASGELAASKYNSNYYAVPVSAFHGQMAELLVNTQSRFVLDTLPEDI